MDKYEARRLGLLRLVNKIGRGGRARVAEAIGKSPDYVARMLYPKDKPGHKGIGEESADLLDKTFPDWLDLDDGFLGAMESPSVYLVKRQQWPFKTITREEWGQIPEPIQQVIEQQIKAIVPPKQTGQLAA